MGASGAPAGLPLWEAALAWCDPALVRELLEAQFEYAQEFQLKPRDNPFPTVFERNLAAQLRVAEIAGVGQGSRGASAGRRLRAAHVVAEDFRRRIGAGEITLTGLRTKPQLEAVRSAVPPLWAKLLVFDWTKGSLRAADAEFVEVTGERGASFRRGTIDPGGPAPARTRPAASEPRVAAKTGRPRFPLGAMAAIAVGRLGKRRSSSKAEAAELLRVFGERFPDRQPPAHRTVCDHLKEIYAQAAAEAAALKPQK